jgi:formate dehydrogenase subunit gamma
MSQQKIIRHVLMDRVFHWLFAVVILVLLLTGLLPPLGINFSWVFIHWVTGVIMIMLLMIHIIRSLFWKSLKTMMIGSRDFSKAKPGKYSLEQKLMHNFLSFISLAAIVTGGLMMVRIDTPFWERNPFWLEASSWGYVYVIHGLMALVIVSTLMLHIYFALRPEKRMYLRAMIIGWISKEEYLAEHDLD